MLLGTILSRVHVVKTNEWNNKDIKKEATEFVSLSPKQRIDKVALIVKENKSEENSG